MKTHSHTILNPRITEKGAYLSEGGVYVFNVAKSASKKEISAAITAVFKVTPRKVTIATVKGKTRLTRGTNRTGASATGKKAYVFLKKGDTIEIV